MFFVITFNFLKIFDKNYLQNQRYVVYEADNTPIMSNYLEQVIFIFFHA